MSPQESIAHYRITSKLGEGGMGAVYRARDSKLNRDVAIKVLPEAFAADPDRLARFTRESQVLASLNHPNIAAIYGVEERAIVLELVEGPELAGPMSEEQALPIVEQLIDALEYAHEKGIIHRDLKPANLKLTTDGRLKVLDFGLAKAMAEEPAPGNPMCSPTLTMRATQAGIIVGTAAYMSPEQARGQAVDKRADIWSFGVVLYELLTGRQLFAGDTVSDTLAAVLKTDPDLSAAPPRFHRLLRFCLARDPRRRLHDISSARLLLDEPAPASVRAAGPWKIVAAVAALAAVGAGVAWRAGRTEPRPLLRFSADLGPDALGGVAASVTLSPDATRLFYSAKDREGRQMLAVRPLDQPQASFVAGAEGGSYPFFSPDGEWIGFFADGRLREVPVHGGPATTLVDGIVDVRGATWLEDGAIVFAPSPSSPLLRWRPGGGKPEAVTDPARKGQITHRWPQAVPGGRYVLFTAHTTTADLNNAEIDALDLKTGQWSTVVRGGYFGRYLPSGHLVFVHDSALMAARFDPGRAAVTGTPVPVLDDVGAVLTNADGRYSFSTTGLLAYISGKATVPDKRLVWLDRGAPPESWNLPAGYYSTPRLSPDGRLVSISLGGVGNDTVRVYDRSREMMVPLTFSGAYKRHNLWAPDGRHLVYVSAENNRYSLWWARADGGGEPVKFWESALAVIPNSFSPDGRRLVYSQSSPETVWDLYTLPVDIANPEAPRAGTPEVFLRTPNAEFDGVFSPDGRWIAYVGRPAGRNEVYVRPFPGPGGVWQVSFGGALQPRWSPAGKRLFFLDLDGRVLAADYVTRGDTFVAGKPQLWNNTLISPQMLAGGGGNYDVSPDGKRVLALIPPDATEQRQNPHVTVLVNFFDELKRRVP